MKEKVQAGRIQVGWRIRLNRKPVLQGVVQKLDRRWDGWRAEIRLDDGMIASVVIGRYDDVSRVIDLPPRGSRVTTKLPEYVPDKTPAKLKGSKVK